MNELSASLVVEYTDCISDSVVGNKLRRYEARCDGRDIKVDIVVRCVAVLVSNDTMILVGSSELFGTGDTRIALNGDWGGEEMIPAGSGGICGK